MAKKKDELAVQEETAITTGFEAYQDADIIEIIQDELDGLDVNFEKIKIPSGGVTVFQVPSGDPDVPETVNEFSAVILYHHRVMIYYKDKYTGGNAPPDCISYDGRTGEGDPGGTCKTCPYNRFGSGENGAKACKKRSNLYLLREGEVFPKILSLPTGSLKAFTKYIMHVTDTKKRKVNTVVTKFSLKAVQNSTGLLYSQGQFKVDRDLTPDERKQIGALAEIVEEHSKQMEFSYQDIDEEYSTPTEEYIPDVEIDPDLM
jgi:hypothetical protein